MPSNSPITQNEKVGATTQKEIVDVTKGKKKMKKERTISRMELT